MRAMQEIDENCIFAKSRKHQLGNIFADFTFNEILMGLGGYKNPILMQKIGFVLRVFKICDFFRENFS